MNKLLFGSDPEMFVCETIDNEEWAIPVPHFIDNLGIPEIGFDPKRKHPIILKTDHTNIIMDGAAFEFNTRPVDNAKDFYNDIQDAINAVEELAARFGYHTTIKPTVKYDFKGYFKPESDLWYWCTIFGCDKDKDAVNDDYDSPEIDVTKHIWRYGGGHLHTSDNNALLKQFPKAYIKLLAITCGNFSIAHSPYPELEKLRAFKYGQPARYRIQHYPNSIDGVEYRTPSNVWVSKLDMIEGMMYWAQKAYDYLSDPKKGMSIINEFLPTTIENIKNVDQISSADILKVLE